MRNLYSFLIFLSAIASCAKEQNPEDAHREEERRNLERLQRANGKYEGFATRENNQKIPVQLLIETSKNPSSNIDQPIVQTTMRMGLFGGVEIVSSKTSYDWKTNELIATFTKGKDSTENSLELHASISDGKWQHGQLHGARTGVVDLTMDGGPDYQLKTYTDSKEFVYKMTFGDPAAGNQSNSQLQIKRLENSVRLENVTQVESDLPIFPAIQASVVFNGYEETPETAAAAIYDPLRASLQIYLDSGAQIFVKNLYASNLDALSLVEQSPEGLTGSVIVGSTQRDQVKLERSAPTQHTAFNRPSRFVGTYQGSPSAPALNALVYLDYMGQQKTNSSDQIFKVFPAFRLRVLECLGVTQMRERIFDAYAVDLLQGVMKFAPLTGPGSQGSTSETVEVSPDANWGALHGKVINTQTTGGGTVVPKFDVHKVDDKLENGCNYFIGS